MDKVRGDKTVFKKTVYLMSSKKKRGGSAIIICIYDKAVEQLDKRFRAKDAYVTKADNILIPSLEQDFDACQAV